MRRKTKTRKLKSVYQKALTFFWALLRLYDFCSSSWACHLFFLKEMLFSCLPRSPLVAVVSMYAVQVRQSYSIPPTQHS